MKKLVILLLAVAAAVSGEWRQGNYKLVITDEHQAIPTYDTIIAKHWHKVENKFYIITPDSLELWVDNVREIRK